MQRQHPIAALEKLQAIAKTISNPDIEAFKAAGGKVVGCFDPETPVEILEAVGLMPFNMRGTGADGTEYADAYFRQLTCEFVRTTFNQIMAGEYEFLDGAVLFNNCDHMRRIYDNWLTLAGSPAYHQFYLPKKRDEATYTLYKEEIGKFIAATEKRFGVKVTAENLAAAIREANVTRRLIRELYELRKADAVPVTGAEVAAVLTAAGSLPRAKFNALLTELVADLKASPDTVIPRRRLLAASGHADKPEFIEALESQGGIVVADVASNGLKTAAVDIDETGDPLESLCRHYFFNKLPMPRVFGTQDTRMQEVLKLIDDYKVDGVISARLTMCDLWAFEQYMLTDVLEAHDIPHLALEVNYILDGLGQIRTRVQAFVENCPKRAA